MSPPIACIRLQLGKLSNIKAASFGELVGFQRETII